MMEDITKDGVIVQEFREKSVCKGVCRILTLTTCDRKYWKAEHFKKNIFFLKKVNEGD